MLKDKFLGSMMGLAVGDALGAPIEFLARDTYLPITEMRSGGPFHLKAGQWTDDTSLALCMGLSLVEKNSFDAEDIIKRFDQWFQKGYMSCTGHCFDIGNTTKAALLRYAQSGELFSGSPLDPATNGSIMRLAPIPLYFHENLEQTLLYAGESSRITHAPQECIDACKALALFIHRALLGFSKEALLNYSPGTIDIGPDIEAILLGSYKNKSRDEIKATGLATHCLESALWSFYHTDNFNEGVLLAVNLGEDSDTTGAVFGQLAGAFYGYQCIRKDFLDQLWDKEKIMNLALELYLSKHNPFFYKGENPTVDLIVVSPSKKILMITRSTQSNACPGMLAFPGGFIDSQAAQFEAWLPGFETPKEAALRELAEETNLKLQNSDQLKFVGEYVGCGRDPRDNSLSWSKTYAFLVILDEKTFELQKNSILGLDDADEALWVDLDKLLLMKLAFDHKKILEDALRFL